ncbi:hypothetical protein AAFF_G00367130 [Aldrovandia affinis]|uniref:Perforin-1-like n=1 Tax=Aldrovandia affinis TaxID=143900 RepID=A0AAD7WMY3_9TELE|nr:hypothetical protein AAFF_G00367130 [Aldrovandia affinis]
MSLYISVLWAGFLLSHPLPTSQSCSTGLANECKEAELAPGTNLAGEGFDITKMQRKGAYVLNLDVWKRKDKTCTICRNPYLDGKMQKLPLSVVDWRPNHQCNMKVSSTIHQSSESLVSSSSNSVENNWKINLEVTGKVSGSLMMAGTHSKLADYSMDKTKKDKFSFTSHQVSCLYYSYRVSNKPHLHREFLRAVQNLPKAYTHENKPRYYKLIDIFGTHYITKVELGGSVHSVTSIRQCEASLQGLNVEEVKTCLDVEAAASVGFKAKLSTEVKHCNTVMNKMDNKVSFSSRFNDRFTEIRGGHTTQPDLLFSANKEVGAYKEWMQSLIVNPDLVSYSLDALHELLPTTNPVRSNLRKAISHYILEKSLWKNCSAPCTAGVKTHPKDSCICTCHNNPGVTPDCCPSQKGLARVKITMQKAVGLWGDYNTGTDGYVKLFHLRKELGRTRSIYNTNNPHWDWTFELGSVILLIDDQVIFEVWDEDNKWDDDFLGKCSVQLISGVNTDLCKLNHGELYYKIEVECAPSLGGRTCDKYIESPMNFHLEKAYVSRNARPVPKEMLVKMGVLMDDYPSYANHSISSVIKN